MSVYVVGVGRMRYEINESLKYERFLPNTLEESKTRKEVQRGRSVIICLETIDSLPEKEIFE